MIWCSQDSSKGNLHIVSIVVVFVVVVVAIVVGFIIVIFFPTSIDKNDQRHIFSLARFFVLESTGHAKSSIKQFFKNLNLSWILCREKVFCKNYVRKRWKTTQKSKRFQKNSKTSKRFQLLPNASECIPMGPNGSESLEKLAKNLKKLAKTLKNFAQTSKNFAKNFTQFFFTA